MTLHSSLFSNENTMSLFWRHLEETETTVEEDNEKDWASLVVTNFFLFALIFGLSASVDAKNLISQLHNKWAILTGICMQFVIMPLLGFLSVAIFKNSSGFTHAMAIALLVVTTSPGGSYSNWWCSTFNADLALSVAMTAVSTVLSVGMLPANLLLYSFLAFGVTSDDESIVDALDFGAIFLSLGIVIAAILSGLYASYKMHSRTFQQWSNRIGSISGIVLIVVSAFLSSGQGDAETSFWSQPWEFYIAVGFPCLVGILLANLLSRCFRLSRPECVAVSIECCYQNVGIATSVGVNMFSDPTERAQALAVPLFYGVLEAIVIGIYCVWAWKVGWTKAPAGEKLCVVVTHTYELDRPVPRSSSQQGTIESTHDGDQAPQDDNDEEEEGEETLSQAQEEHRLRQIEEMLANIMSWPRWYRWLFEPRYPYGHSRSQRETAIQFEGEEEDDDNAAMGDIETQTPVKKKEPSERHRFVSEDYTATTSGTSTSMSSPPTTPGGSFETLPHDMGESIPEELAIPQEAVGKE